MPEISPHPNKRLTDAEVAEAKRLCALNIGLITIREDVRLHAFATRALAELEALRADNAIMKDTLRRLHG